MIAILEEFRKKAAYFLIPREIPRLCRGGRKSLTVPEIGVGVGIGIAVEIGRSISPVESIPIPIPIPITIIFSSRFERLN